MTEKHLGYYEVLDSFKAKECPLCSFVKTRIEKYYDNLLYENVNNIGFRERFYKNKGFCNHHTYKLLSYHDGLAVSLMHKDFLKDVIEESSKPKIRTLYKKTNNECIICEHAEETENIYIYELTNFFNDFKMKDKYLQSEGFCIPHYRAIINLKKELPDWLKEFQLARYKELLVQLYKYLESNNVTNNKKEIILTGEEKLIWNKIIKTLYGYEGISG